MLFGEGSGASPVWEGPSIVLLDLKLPKIDGIGVLARIRGDARTRQLRVFALSSSEDPRELETCLRLGVVAVLPKPLDPVMLARWFPPSAAPCHPRPLPVFPVFPTALSEPCLGSERRVVAGNRGFST